MSLFQTASSYAQVVLPNSPQGTASYTVVNNASAADLQPAATYYALPAIDCRPARFAELPTVTKPDQSQQFLPKPRALGLGLGSAWMSDDFDAH